MKRIVLGLLLVIGVSPIAKAQVGDTLVGTAAVVKEQGISDEELFRTTIQTLSADEFGGRKPLSVHETPVLSYIEEKFKEVGLEPANGNSYFQEVPMLSVRTHIKNNQIVVKGAKGSAVLRYWDETVVWSLRGEKSLKLSKADFVFVGFGINAPEYGWNDYEGVNVKDKIVVTLVNDPGYYDDNLFRGKNMTYYGRWTYKFEEASRQGAAGAIIIHETAPASYDWSVIQNSHSDAS
ncbi:MAG: peptidase M28, partial [Mediterranea sp.]|nr:peptidase M28 [Mediterranea sp.]